MVNLLPALVLASLVSWPFLHRLEYSSVYLPSKTVSVTPENAGIPYENISLATEDNLRLQAWFIPVKDAGMQSSVPTILYCHGQRGNIGSVTGLLDIFNRSNYNVFTFDYRGYGNSEGKCNEQGLYRDAMAAFRYLRSRPDIDVDKIIIYGHSLGGTIAIDLAAKVDKEILALVTEGTPGSTVAVAKKRYPLLPVKLLMTQEFDALSKIRAVTAPKLIIHSTEDEVIPFRQGELLYEEASEPKEFMATTGGHDEAFPGHAEEYMEKLKSLLTKYVARRAQ